MKTLTICADDFAQNLPISRGILALIAQGRVAATSVMSESPCWPALAPELAAVAVDAECGLHVNLTHRFDVPVHGLFYWATAGQLHRFHRVRLRDTVLRQIDRFADHFHRLPDFIDGHQHIHAVPAVREALFEAIGARWHNHELPYLRIPAQLVDFGDAWFKAWVVKLSGAGFGRRAQALGFITTVAFAGLYSLETKADFPRLMEGWLAHCPDGCVVMCHPGLGGDGMDDPSAAVRALEYRYLSSQSFIEMTA